MLDNAEWLTKLNWIEMLRDTGKHFSVNRMLTMDSVRLRLEREQEMSFIEFDYMVSGLTLSNSRDAPAAACRWAAPTSGAIRHGVSGAASSRPFSASGRGLVNSAMTQP